MGVTQPRHDGTDWKGIDRKGTAGHGDERASQGDDRRRIADPPLHRSGMRWAKLLLDSRQGRPAGRNVFASTARGEAQPSLTSGLSTSSHMGPEGRWRSERSGFCLSRAQSVVSAAINSSPECSSNHLEQWAQWCALAIRSCRRHVDRYWNSPPW